MDYKTKSVLDYLSHEIQQAEALAEAWENIERYKTKDGRDFKNIAANFTKGAIRSQRYNRDEKAIHVCIGKNHQHYYDDFNIDITVYSYSADAKKYATEGRLIERGEFLHPYVEMTPDEIEEAIKNRAAYWRNIAKRNKEADAKLEDVLARAYKIKQQYDPNMQQLRKALENMHSEYDKAIKRVKKGL